ncbi:MAG: hypothetical protein HY319_05415 [Armatimonadetes bacterium]|nr:hypothetical protein [Armatimonadota bacterium]
MVDAEMQNMIAVIPIPGNPRRYRISMPHLRSFWEPDAALPEPTLELLESVAGPILPAGTRMHTLRWGSIYSTSHRIVPGIGWDACSWPATPDGPGSRRVRARRLGDQVRCWCLAGRAIDLVERFRGSRMSMAGRARRSARSPRRSS